MEPRDRFRPAAAGPEPPNLHEVQRQIERLDREDRAMLRPWILARYDVRGYRTTGAVRADATVGP
ncbi:MAG TPA: hypothetical protein VHS78_12675 [Candidatus Elarobacter sp.]|jgi:hypothetical protein|nr:hypothetical protein [Candidatus Elarobacter sp.]